MMGKSLLALFGFLALSVFAAGAGSLFTPGMSPGDWYRELQRPPGTPPNWVFGPVWTLLYTLMAVAAWRVWRTGDGSPRWRAFGLYGIQLGLNALWTPVFFGWQQPGWALVVILFLLAAILATNLVFLRVDRLAGMLFLPYLVWVGYASYLNAGFWILNR